MEDIDAVPSNVQSACQEALLYVFEDNEAVIKMIIKGRSPTMRHVSRTHRVGLDWLFDRINLDPKIQIKYIDTKNQLADILTKGSGNVGDVPAARDDPIVAAVRQRFGSRGNHTHPRVESCIAQSQ